MSHPFALVSRKDDLMLGKKKRNKNDNTRIFIIPKASVSGKYLERWLHGFQKSWG